MNVLMLEWNSFGNEDIKEAFTVCGHTVSSVFFDQKSVLYDDKVKDILRPEIEKNKPDFVFGFNYFPPVASLCNDLNVKYVAWVYDNPYVLLYSYTVIYPTNYIFVFDKSQYNEFRANGIPTFYYLPLAANTDRLTKMVTNPDGLRTYRASSLRNRTDIAFIGSLYTEDHKFYDKLTSISDYTRGYLEGLMAAQKQIYGMNFIEGLLPSEIIEDMNQDLMLKPGINGCETLEYMMSQYVINRQLTATERYELLSKVGAKYKFDLYTHDKNFRMDGCINHGPADYYDEAPYIFNSTPINLNITLRSIHSGIPLRAFDILGAGGFLLTNYQADFDDCYVSGEDYVFFESPDDMMAKIDYYLSHEDERKQIAENGFRRTAESHTYINRVCKIVEIVKN